MTEVNSREDEKATALALGSATLFESGANAGALPSAIRPIAPGQRLAGRAFPVQAPPGDNLWLHHALESAAPGDVLVVSVGAGAEHGYFGEVMAEAALARGIQGMVIDGGVRDTARMAELGFAVFSERVCVRGTTKNPALAGALGRPVLIGDAVVHRGDLVVGDDDGVVVIPSDDVPEALANGLDRERAERRIIERLRAGEGTVGIYGLAPLPDGAPAR
ncbi:4-carboxy-4-hydroxy-2-oxoadipate aldolase/oxaloacetate decarboxylase [Spirillospora sp. NPDC029432]|uniref:4-carboxy-4-hydroxy-2-oxoadipate aldolase/oxaloacetate decarboxylase n=1 Tax=Spirillospora sp. NPDC029432 TaxID=3154599 RepID=UPI003452FD64